MKTGLITLHDYNFGSALQCYATQSYINKYYCDCVLIQKREPTNRLRSVFQRIMNYVGLSAKHPFQIKRIYEQVKAQRAGRLTITKDSLKEIKRFNYNYIFMELYSFDELSKAAASLEYDYFLSGSDQVWNGFRVDGTDMFFLRFAPPEKRIAWAPSFGSDCIAPYNMSIFKQYISEYSRLSVREESGQRIIKELINKESELLCDPVLLLTASEWREQYLNSAHIKNHSKYILLFFIDEISDYAMQRVQEFQKRTDYQVISFGYDYKKYTSIERHIHIDGSPFDFLKMIDQSDLVITDSFHATIFSLIFHKEFYTYSRKYTHRQNQSTRIELLLERTGIRERFDAENMQKAIDYSRTDSLFIKERARSDSYLESFLGEKRTETKDENP